MRARAASHGTLELQPETPTTGKAATGTRQCYNRCPASCKRHNGKLQTWWVIMLVMATMPARGAATMWWRAAVTDVGGGNHAGGGQHRRGTVLQSTPRSYHGCNTEAREKAAMVNDLFVESDDGEHRR
ncbi:hypothetical protein CFC21_094057 [Triticum aestivum]|uniref:Uncharacterized protein n=2 Tax=Triticum aestivum TaxID=4565 RepID=A0A9R1LMD8_WHEAT|nr:hypothetical protein CFC21_094054 [Triticum aestivum]KAF7091486.1 hypothetical protein CFC21_094057 [Triticum aestivum]